MICGRENNFIPDMLPNQNGKMLTLILTYSHNISSMKSGATKLQKAAKKALLDDAFATTNREHDYPRTLHMWYFECF